MKNILKNIVHVTCAGGIVGFLTFTSMVNFAHAETVITDGYLHQDTVWSKVGSPYVLQDSVTVPAGITLRVEPGVEVIPDPMLAHMPYTPSLSVFGTLVLRGSSNDLIHVANIGGITVDHGQTDISYVALAMKGPLAFRSGAQGHIASSTVSNTAEGTSQEGIYVERSSVTIESSKIDGRVNGIRIRDYIPVPVRKDVPSVLGNVKNVLEKVGILKIARAETVPPSTVFITGSSLVNNIETAIRNDGNDGADNVVVATHNWWGSIAGPQIIQPGQPNDSVSNGIKGEVTYQPWLDHDPFVEVQTSPCCSSVLFLPGLEATRLYRQEVGISNSGQTENQLWEPNRNDDVRKLFLNSHGSSTDSSIYAGLPIGRALGFFGVYGSFMNFLDELAEKGTIGEWKSFGYDWRKPIAEVVAGRTQRATTTASLIETVQDLASRSRTGKVTLIAHSNGGLVAKYLVKTLAEMGKENLIESVISVAVPYLGTPQSILALLEGDKQAIAAGLILKKSVAKEFATNMPSAYSLVPSATYFEKVLGPTIAYASGTNPPIASAKKQDAFIGSHANKLLMTAAETFHNILDPFTWPTTIARWAIVGWGNKTAKGIEYTGPSSSPTSKYEASKTSMGDGTVVAPSAAYNSGTTTAINLPTVSRKEWLDLTHSNILEASATMESVENIITSSPNAPGYNAKAIEDALSKIPGVSIGEPDYSKEATFLVVSTHSPVDLHVYDKDGNHTGSVPIPPEYGIEDDIFSMVETKIPGSSYDNYGDEDQPEIYISLPDDSGEKYSVVIQGTGVGEFTYTVERIKGDVTLSSIEYTGLPSTPLMIASTTVVAGVLSTTTVLTLDLDGNGSIDTIAQPNTSLDPIVFLESLKSTILQLLGPNRRSDGIVRRINKIEDLFKKNKLRKIDAKVNNLKKKIGSKKFRNLSQSDKDTITDMIDQFLVQFE